VGLMTSNYALFLLLVIALGSGCHRHSKNETPTRELTKMPFSAEEARAALVRMVESGDNELFKTALDRMRSDPIQEEEGGIAWLGPWRINLNQRAFDLTINTRQGMLRYEGTFKQRRKGGWDAIVNKTLRGTV
jgi:hypothetical protein